MASINDQSIDVQTSSACVPIERMLHELCDGTRDAASLADALGVSLLELARAVNHADNVALLEGLLRLSQVRTALTICRYRHVAAAVLVKIAAHKAEGEGHDDLSRKACVDLLNVELPKPPSAQPAKRGPAKVAGDGAARGEPSTATVEAILAAFDRLEQQEAIAFAAMTQAASAPRLP